MVLLFTHLHVPSLLFFFLWNTKGEFLKIVNAAFFHNGHVYVSKALKKTQQHSKSTITTVQNIGSNTLNLRFKSSNGGEDLT